MTMRPDLHLYSEYRPGGNDAAGPYVCGSRHNNRGMNERGKSASGIFQKIGYLSSMEWIAHCNDDGGGALMLGDPAPWPQDRVPEKFAACLGNIIVDITEEIPRGLKFVEVLDEPRDFHAEAARAKDHYILRVNIRQGRFSPIPDVRRDPSLRSG